MLHSLGLIDVGHLLAEVARTGVDHEIQIPLIVLVELNKMIAAAKRPDRLIDTPRILDLAVAVELKHELLGLAVNVHLLPHKRLEAVFILARHHPRGHIRTDMLIESMKIDVAYVSEPEYAHTATYVHPHDVGDHLVAQVAGKTDHTSRAGVHVGHDAYLLIGEHIY